MPSSLALPEGYLEHFNSRGLDWLKTPLVFPESYLIGLVDFDWWTLQRKIQDQLHVSLSSLTLCPMQSGMDDHLYHLFT